MLPVADDQRSDTDALVLATSRAEGGRSVIEGVVGEGLSELAVVVGSDTWAVVAAAAWPVLDESEGEARAAISSFSLFRRASSRFFALLKSSLLMSSPFAFARTSLSMSLTNPLLHELNSWAFLSFRCL